MWEVSKSLLDSKELISKSLSLPPVVFSNSYCECIYIHILLLTPTQQQGVSHYIILGDLKFVHSSDPPASASWTINAPQIAYVYNFESLTENFKKQIITDYTKTI